MSEERDALREQLAALAHTQWSGWMRYQWSRCVRVPSNGCLIIPAEWMERWQRQVDTAYADLPEHDKESDRAEADRVLALLSLSERDALCAALREEYVLVLLQRDYWTRTPDQDAAGARFFEWGARAALECVATRIGVPALHDQVADVLAREGWSEDQGP